jgi:hypothetical protein
MHPLFVVVYAIALAASTVTPNIENKKNNIRLITIRVLICLKQNPKLMNTK